MKTIEDFMQAVDPMLQRLRGSVRRMAVTLSSKALWQVAGHVIDGKTETMRAEPFTGIGLYARPPASGKPEAIVQMIGDAKAPVITAVRDEKTRAAVAGAIKPDETMLFNSKACVYVKDDETIEARKPSGEAGELATKKDLQYIRMLISALPGGGAALGTIDAMIAAETPPDSTSDLEWPRGTKVLKGE